MELLFLVEMRKEWREREEGRIFRELKGMKGFPCFRSKAILGGSAATNSLFRVL